MKNIILLIILFVSFISAQNCKQISDEIKASISKDVFESEFAIIQVQNGVICDNGKFYNSFYPFDNISACFYDNWSKNQRTIIFTYKGTNYIQTLKLDEFDMVIHESEVTRTARSCPDMYKEFKRDMK